MKKSKKSYKNPIGSLVIAGILVLIGCILKQQWDLKYVILASIIIGLLYIGYWHCLNQPPLFKKWNWILKGGSP